MFCLLVYFALCIVHTGFSSHFRVCFISLHGFKVPAAGSDKTPAFWGLAADWPIGLKFVQNQNVGGELLALRAGLSHY